MSYKEVGIVEAGNKRHCTKCGKAIEKGEKLLECVYKRNTQYAVNFNICKKCLADASVEVLRYVKEVS